MSAVVLGVLLLSVSPAAETPRALHAVVELGLGQYAERMSVGPDDDRRHDDRWLWHDQLAVGVRYTLRADWLPEGTLRGQSSLGLGLVYVPGHWPITVQQSLLWLHPVSKAVSFVTGVSTSLWLNTTDPAFSSWRTGLCLGVALGPVELTYDPVFSVGLGADRRTLPEGELVHSVRTGFVPLNLALRFVL